MGPRSTEGIALDGEKAVEWAGTLQKGRLLDLSELAIKVGAGIFMGIMILGILVRLTGSDLQWGDPRRGYSRKWWDWR